MAPFEALYGRSCRYPVGWFEVGKGSILRPELVYDSIEKVRLIRDKMSLSGYKSYPDVRKRDLQFEMGDCVYSNMKGVMRG